MRARITYRIIGEPKPRSVAMTKMTRTIVGSHPQYSATPPQTPSNILFLDERVNLVRLMIHSGFVMIINAFLCYSYVLCIYKLQNKYPVSLQTVMNVESSFYANALRSKFK